MRTRQEKMRLGFLFVLVCFGFTLVSVRLVQLQVILGPAYGEIVSRQSSGTLPIPARRGILYDRNGTVIANNVTLSSLYAYPGDNAEVKKVAKYVERLFGLQAGSAVTKYGLAPKRFRWIKRKMDDALTEKVLRDEPAGLHLREEAVRDYPFGEAGKQILGFTDIDNKGQAGIELMFDSLLAGQNGFADFRRDGLQNTYRVKETAMVKPVPGISKVLTIDWRLQQIVEEELREGALEYNASSGMAVFLNSSNGEILAMAHFDPQEKNSDKPMKLRAITDQFEPGSVFKVITAAGLLEDDLVNYRETTYCENGAWLLGRKTLHDDKELGWLTFRQIVEYSSNIGMAKYAIKQGGETLVESIKKFGVGSRTGLGWPGESSGRIGRANRWSDYMVASLAMGHGVTVSALQMANAMAAVANGGKLYRPRIVVGDVDLQGNVINRTSPEVISEVLSGKADDSLKAFLAGVVERGTGKDRVKSKIVAIAGKTGTAQIPNPENGRYFHNRYMGSFAGYFPAESPLITGIIVLENPQPVHYGGWTAGPIFRRVAERYTILHPDLFAGPEQMLAERSDEYENTVIVPDLVGFGSKQAITKAKDKGLKVRANGEAGVVVWQFPMPDRLAIAGDEIIVVVEERENARPFMADLTGLSIREVSAFLKQTGIKFRVSGNGRVVSQSISPGEELTENAVCRLVCQPI